MGHHTEQHEHLEFALELAKAAEGEILGRYRGCTVERKPDGSDVTEADRQAETVMRRAIAERFPAHAVLGEEFGAAGAADARYRWVLDPLDGTTWFTLGVPAFGTLIGLLEDGDPVLGVIHLPVQGETVYAAKGLGCWFRSHDAEPQRVQVREAAPLSGATVSASGVHGSDLRDEGDGPAWRLGTVVRRAGRFRFCGDCLQHALVGRGRIHAAIDTIMKPWDVAALVPCVEEAGGTVTTLSGRRDDIVNGGSLLSSCHPSLHREILGLLGKSPS